MPNISYPEEVIKEIKEPNGLIEKQPITAIPENPPIPVYSPPEAIDEVTNG